MKYLFFDIESSDGTHGMCEFSYIITDEQFNIIEEKETLINPDFMFIRDERKAPLYYSHKEYLAAPKFPFYHKMIKDLLLQNDIKIFGFSVGNDINYLEDNCIRYNLEILNFKAYDVQKIHAHLGGIPSNRQLGMEDALIIVPYDKRKDFTAHRALADAKMTMLILKYLVLFKGLKMDTLVQSTQFLLDGITHANAILERKKWRDEHPSTLKWNKLARKTDRYLRNAIIRKPMYSISQVVQNDEALMSKIVEKFRSNKTILPTNAISRANYHIVKAMTFEEKPMHKNIEFITVDKFLGE